MIVCICNAIREEELRASARRGAPCARTAYKSLGCEVQCGMCLPAAKEVIADERAKILRVDSKAA